ncbi:MAG: ABC transporter substrate-binding protein [Burkholderiales bacterium]|jgi:sulfonate transport system substrate-binding protein|nr:ABC transporter substrate-binding protein [Microcystis sp. M020S1]MCA3176553.1 ABC transporter substrate-binding protein [Burkholderiales bacterium]
MSEIQSIHKPVELWYTRCGSATASALAIQKNWLQEEFNKNGTLLRSLRDSHSLEVRNSHYHHKQSGMFREGGNIPPIWAKGQGQDTVVVGITWLDEYQGILARADSGINNIYDLKGKRLGIPKHAQAVIDFQRGAAQHGFYTALNLAGLSVSDAIFVDLDAPSYDTEDGPRKISTAKKEIEIEALNNGTVDAIFLRFARGFRLSKDPQYTQVININDHPDPLVRVNNGTPRPITVDRKFLNQHPEIVARYLAVLLRTANWAENHQKEVLQLLSNESSDSNSGSSIADVIGSHGNNVHKSFTPALSDQYIAGLNAQKNFLRDWGYVENDFDIHDWISHEPLRRAHELLTEKPFFNTAGVALAA